MNMLHTSLLERASLEGSYLTSSLSWAQLAPGSFNVAYRVVQAPPLSVSLRRYNMALQAEATVQSEKCIVAVVADRGSHARWFGTRFDGDCVAYTRSALDVRTDGPSGFFAVTVDERRLQLEFPDAPDVADFTEGKRRAGVARNRIAAERLRASLHRVCGGDAVLSPMLAGTLIPLVASTFQDFGDHVVEPSKSLNRRFRAVRACEAYMREHVDRTITLLDLSHASGMRSRSLIYAFEAVTGFSPMDYLKRLRLNGARRALQTASNARVIDVATAWGFWHMGHFASDYRAMFGEAPSQTLLRS